MQGRIWLLAALILAHYGSAASTGPKGAACKDDQGVEHSVGSKWQPDPCTFCQCTKAKETICAAQSCAPLECSEGMVPELPNEERCCATKCVNISTSLVAGDCQTVCSTKWEPVCGTDGSTYTNLCHLQLAQCVRNDEDFKVSHKGVCTEEEEAAAKGTTNKPTSTTTSKRTSTTTRRPATVSGKSDVETMTNPVLPTSVVSETANGESDNECSAVECPPREKCEPGFRLTTDEAEPCCQTCVEDEECPKICIKMFDPVCGTDGQTYSSQCDMMSIACEQGLNVQVSSKGRCESDGRQDEAGDGPRPVPPPQTPGDCNLVVCSLDYTPVCGSDGITYDNICKLGMASCMSQKAGGESLYMSHSGTCSESAPSTTSAVTSTATPTAASSQPTSKPASATNEPVIVEPESPSDSSTRAIAIGVSVALGVVILCLVMIGAGIMIKRARKARREAKPSVAPSELPIDGNASAISTVPSGPMAQGVKKNEA